METQIFEFEAETLARGGKGESLGLASAIRTVKGSPKCLQYSSRCIRAILNVKKGVRKYPSQYLLDEILYHNISQGEQCPLGQGRK